MSGTESISRFACTDDPTPEATDTEMAQVFGINWQQMTYGEQYARVNELLKPLGQWLEPACGAGHHRNPPCRHVEHATDAIWYWSSIRQAAKYVLSH